MDTYEQYIEAREDAPRATLQPTPSGYRAFKLLRSLRDDGNKWYSYWLDGWPIDILLTLGYAEIAKGIPLVDGLTPFTITDQGRQALTSLSR